MASPWEALLYDIRMHWVVNDRDSSHVPVPFAFYGCFAVVDLVGRQGIKYDTVIYKKYVSGHLDDPNIYLIYI